MKTLNKIAITIFIFLFAFNAIVFSQKILIRKPAVAGSFYPSGKLELKEMIERFLKNTGEPKLKERQISALITPHAGYIYSGQVAAYGFNELIERDFETVIIIGPSHYFRFDGASIYNADGFMSPLGLVEIDKKLCDELMKNSKIFSFNENAHAKEHSIEVEIPFIQSVLPKAKIVPIVIWRQDLSFCEDLSRQIAKSIKNKNVLLIASSDMSHFHPYAKAKLMDEKILHTIENFSIEKTIGLLAKNESELCGAGPVITTMLVSKEFNAINARILKYANSGDITGDKNSVVGYSSIAFLKQEENDNENDFSLTKEDKKILLKIARQAIEDYIQNKQIPKFNIEDKNLNKPCGAFVTINKFGNLRGCIGNFTSQEPLYKVISKMSILSATQDDRFRPVRQDELKDIEIEISVLTPLKRIEKIDEIQLGKHGIYITYGSRNGCFLPQVATETGWTKEEFVRNCAIEKAGISPSDIKKAEIYVFEAEVFSEKDFKK